ncbi:unnamed protein product [Echinostoma caproni]|uniref:BTB_3 domain-containing protein n=1 Tax=Echinostoma caproni TaxID=27848 RepID=A0A183AHQ0_9TREM|nr:unnamed protein product [Echinostoma caproni]
MSAGETHAELSDRDTEKLRLGHTGSRTRSHSAGSVPPQSTSFTSSPPHQAVAAEDSNPMDSSDVATPRKSDPLPAHHVVKFKPCLVLRPSSSSSPRSPIARFSGHPAFSSILADQASDLVTNGCLSDPLPFSTVASSARVSTAATAAAGIMTATKSSSLKPCRSVGRAHRAGFSSPPPPPPPPDAIRTLLIGDDGDEEEGVNHSRQLNTFGILSRSRRVGEDSGDTEFRNRPTSHNGTPPLAQAVVAALKQNQHHLFRSIATTTTTTTTSTASSSRFSPAYLSDENEAADIIRGADVRRRVEDAAQEADSDTDSVSYGDDDEDDDANRVSRATFSHTDQAAVELDGESGYGASCSSSSVRLRFSSRRDKRRQKRRVQRRSSVGTSTAETHSSPGEDEQEDREHSESSSRNRSALGDSANGRHTPNSSPVCATIGEFTDLSSSARRLIPARNASNRHKRNRVRILDDEQQQDQTGKITAAHADQSASRNRRRAHLVGLHSAGEVAQPGDENADDDDSESPGLAHTHSSLPSYPCSIHRYSIDTGSAPSIPTSDTEANRPESDAFDAVVESSPVTNLAGLSPGAAMPPPPNAVPSASILVMPTNSQTHHNTSLSPFTSMSSATRGAWHSDMSSGVPLAHATAYQLDTQTDAFHTGVTNYAQTHSVQPCLCSTHNHEAHSGWWESSNCSWYGPGEASSAFHPAPLCLKSRQSSTHPSTLPFGWTQPSCSGAHSVSQSCSCRPSTSFSIALGDEITSSPPPPSQQQEKRFDSNPPLLHNPGPTRVSLVVDKVRVIVDAQVLQSHPDTMLGRMISSHFLESSRLAESASIPGPSTQLPESRPHPPDILVAQNSNISAHLFRAVLDYYLLGHISCPPGVPVQELKETCDYFLIPFNHHTVRCANLRAFLHELSNDGARANFAEFLETHILSLLVKCARTGERECHVVIVTDDETIVWDPEFPPQMPENELQSHIIYSTHMFRFLKYIENREVAKQVLLERGLKKIRIGIEGYPTCKDRMKFRPGFRPEAIYNYVQCPFLRMSWEEEENKSRHVDFQCVKSKSVSDLTTGLEQAVVDPLPPPHLIRSPPRSVSPERPDHRSASFAAQVDNLDPDGPLVLEGNTTTSPLIDAFDPEDLSPGHPESSRARTVSPLPNASSDPPDREDEEEEDDEPRISPSNPEPDPPEPSNPGS